ncbi:MAG: hypothetical protein IKR25_07890 [Muribaculaceae bacterium]|nr:hypothetical protein [Muribaculaceae bacterium]
MFIAFSVFKIIDPAKLVQVERKCKFICYLPGVGGLTSTVGHIQFQKQKTSSFVLHCARFALPLAVPKVGGSSVMQKQKTSPFVLHFARFALPLAAPKVGGSSVMQKQKTSPFVLHCARFALPLQFQKNFTHIET